jgi:murein DD-endopeptidase MepM/ murein hydrolase activator NlpD
MLKNGLPKSHSESLLHQKIHRCNQNVFLGITVEPITKSSMVRQGELIPVFSVCEGNIRFVGTINGYGGVIIQECMLDDSPVQVLYGHVSLQNAVITVGEKVQEGEQISLLGEHFSAEAGGERKHLHLGIRKGKEIDFRGYVQSESELDNWIDFESWRTTSL